MRLWDHTALSCLEACEEEFVRRYVHGLTPTTPEASKLFGGALHEGVGALYDGDSVERASEAAAAHWRETLEEEREREKGREGLLPVASSGRGAGFVGEAADGSLILVAKPHLGEGYLRKLVAMYAELRSPLDRALLNEAYLERPTEGFCGIVDRVVERGGVLAVDDLKTTGLYIGEKWAKQWGHSAQAAGYLDLAGDALGRDIREFWVDAVHLDRRGYPKADDFQRYRFEYGPGLRAEFRAQRARLIERANYLLEHPGEAQKRTRACFRFNELCPFFDLCHSEPEEREGRYALAVASGRLEERVWSPKERRGVKEHVGSRGD